MKPKHTLCALLCTAALVLGGCAKAPATSNPANTSAPPESATAGGASTAAGASAIAAIQNDLGGLRRLDHSHQYAAVLYGEPDYDNPENDEMAIARLDDGYPVEYIVTGLRGFGDVFVGRDGTLYYNDFRTGIQIFDPVAATLTPFAAMAGHSFGPSWFADSTHLYTTLHPHTDDPKAENYSLARISLADASVETLPDTVGVYPCDGFGTTLVYIVPTLEDIDLYTIDVATGETGTLLPQPEGYWDLLGGVCYRFQPQNGQTLISAQNLLTGETAEGTIDCEADFWSPYLPQGNTLFLSGWVGAEEIIRRLNLDTGAWLDG